MYRWGALSAAGFGFDRARGCDASCCIAWDGVCAGRVVGGGVALSGIVRFRALFVLAFHFFLASVQTGQMAGIFVFDDDHEGHGGVGGAGLPPLASSARATQAAGKAGGAEGASAARTRIE